ncbi:RagB/SusD family nutrient uptake outer membrane protein [Aquimarina algiphila]|uniref:RagB/SusD family nutrient uptake outer membrane protein n=1 Tax=Aquimarina algiphila TaxID=2047982 RepID=UPI00232C01B7|nr:RagB/SusD family nutrient uptake outer membrane protein [Aquimarina algiphila]
MKIIKIFLITILSSVVLVSCEVEDGKDLNGPSTESISSDLSRGELRDAIFGVLSDMRSRLGTQVDGQAVAGREYWRVASSDPRWTADLLTGTLDDNTFYTTNPYAARYATVKDVNLLLEGLANTTETFTTEEVAGIRGFANTIKAHELLMVLNQQFENGIRVDVDDPQNLGPFLSYDDSLTAIFNLLTDAATDLSNAGSDLPFSLPSGFSDVSILEFNNALAARVEAYRGNYASVLTLLGNSFMNMSGDLSTGAYFTFSLDGADIANPLFFALNSSLSNVRLAHPTFINDADAGDTRLNKVVLRDEPITVAGPDGVANSADDLNATHDVFVFTSNTSSVPIIRNEELILLAAEANHITNPTAAVAAIDVIRTAAGLSGYTGGTTPAELVTEILKQRRYSLYAEGGHRWIDLRRFGRLNSDLAGSIDRPGDAIFDRFPTPANENR